MHPGSGCAREGEVGRELEHAPDREGDDDRVGTLRQRRMRDPRTSGTAYASRAESYRFHPQPSGSNSDHLKRNCDGERHVLVRCDSAARPLSTCYSVVTYEFHCAVNLAGSSRPVRTSNFSVFRQMVMYAPKE